MTSNSHPLSPQWCYQSKKKVARWIETGTVLGIVGAVGAVLLGVVGALERNKRVLVVFTGFCILLGFGMFALGLSSLMVVDTMGPVLGQRAKDYCTSKNSHGSKRVRIQFEVGDLFDLEFKMVTVTIVNSMCNNNISRGIASSRVLHPCIKRPAQIGMREISVSAQFRYP